MKKKCQHCGKASLSKLDKKILDLVVSMSATNSWYVSRSLGVSVPQASTYLKKLFEADFVGRVSRVSGSGGIEYNYFRKPS